MIAVLLLCLGAVSASPLPKIIGGGDVHISYYLHQVSLTVYLHNGTQYVFWHICGGSIIDKNWVLTAAHCLNDPDANYYIQTNDGNLNNVFGIYRVEHITKHPDYDKGPGALQNDIALLYVAGDLTMSGHEAITIASDKNQDFSGQLCEITGWGNKATGDGLEYPDQLQWTYGEILTSSVCGGYWGSNYVHEAHICIHNDYSGSCQGDSGGPMVCPGNVLAGVTSWGAGGCHTYYPSAYARVSSYAEWIRETTRLPL